MNFKKSYTAMMSAAAALVLCTTAALADTNIEFIQWWEPEMPAGALRGIMDGFEAASVILPGDSVDLAIDAAKLHFFDPQTHLAI